MCVCTLSYLVLIHAHNIGKRIQKIVSEQEVHSTVWKAGSHNWTWGSTRTIGWMELVVIGDDTSLAVLDPCLNVSLFFQGEAWPLPTMAREGKQCKHATSWLVTVGHCWLILFISILGGKPSKGLEKAQRQKMPFCEILWNWRPVSMQREAPAPPHSPHLYFKCCFLRACPAPGSK